jgi:hypothetical protein
MLRNRRRISAIYDTDADIDYQLYYKTIKNRKTRHLYPHPISLQNLGDQPLRLVPIKLDLEWDGYKIKDSFTWNLNGIFKNLKFRNLLNSGNVCSVARR